MQKPNSNLIFCGHRLTKVIIFLCVVCAVSTAQAHSDHGKSLHGGIVAEGSKAQVEWVKKEKSWTFFLTDHGRPVSSLGTEGNVHIQCASANQNWMFPLVSQQPDSLSLNTPPALVGMCTIVAVIKIPKKGNVTVRFKTP